MVFVLHNLVNCSRYQAHGISAIYELLEFLGYSSECYYVYA